MKGLLDVHETIMERWTDLRVRLVKIMHKICVIIAFKLRKIWINCVVVTQPKILNNSKSYSLKDPSAETLSKDFCT